MNVAAVTATATASAIGAAVVSNNGIRVAGRAGYGNYNRIAGSTTQWIEGGDTLANQPIYDITVPFFPTSTSSTDISIVGGRTYTHLLEISLNGAPVDITTARFISQIRTTAGGPVIATFTPTITDGPAGEVSLILTAYETQVAAAAARKGYWDVEMHIDGLEVTVVPTSSVTLTMGISQAVSFPVESPAGVSVGFPAEVTVL